MSLHAASSRSLHTLRSSQLARRHLEARAARYLTTSSIRSQAHEKTVGTSSQESSTQASESSVARHEPSWLTRKVQSSPALKKIFLGAANLLGYGSPKQVAGRHALFMYQDICTARAEEDMEFWTKECDLPPTFQSWFTITNLHVWILTVRLRALPKGQGNHYVQGIIDQFFLDVEDRIRHVLQPGVLGSTPPQKSAFYTKPSMEDGKSKRKGRAPERLVTQQMRIFKEQWAGMGLACDLGLVKGDSELAGAMWRNLLGARGARGIAYDPESAPRFRRSVNLMGGEVEGKKMKKSDLEAEEAKDDGSGVHDFSFNEVDKYIKYPTLMATLVEYARREIARLDKIDDAVILQGHLGREFKFSRLPKNISL